VSQCDPHCGIHERQNASSGEVERGPARIEFGCRKPHCWVLAILFVPMRHNLDQPRHNSTHGMVVAAKIRVLGRWRASRSQGLMLARRNRSNLRGERWVLMASIRGTREVPRYWLVTPANSTSRSEREEAVSTAPVSVLPARVPPPVSKIPSAVSSGPRVALAPCAGMGDARSGAAACSVKHTYLSWRKVRPCGHQPGRRATGSKSPKGRTP
jgi:hypothetical protein